MKKQIMQMKQLIIAFFTIILFLSTGIETKAQSCKHGGVRWGGTDNSIPLLNCFCAKHAVGVRLGIGNGITYKTFIAEHRAVDFSLYFSSGRDYSTFRLTGLYEIHTNTDITPGLLWYYGGGASVGSRRSKRIDTSDTLLSVNGVVGLDYKFERAPINLSLDWQASVEVVPSAKLDLGGLSLAIRYTF